MNIAANIKKIRLWKDIPQKAIAHSTGIPQGTLSKIEGGADFSWSQLLSISAALDMSVEDVVCFDASKIAFHMTGDKAKGVVIHHGNIECHEVVKILKEENEYLRKMLEKSITKNNKK